MPLFSSVAFVFGMMLNRMAINRGASFWTGVLYSNLILAAVWLGVGVSLQQMLPVSEWPRAGIVGVTFFLGQILTYMAYRFGNVSVATPVLSVKILVVAVLTAFVARQPVSVNVWLAAALATLGVILVQAGRDNDAQGNKISTWRTILIACGSAFALSVFDVLVQMWGAPHGAVKFLPVMFASAGIASLVIAPWADSAERLAAKRALIPFSLGVCLMAIQAMGMTFALSQFGDATRVNIVYATRGLWAVALAWVLARVFEGGELHATRNVMLLRAAGAILLTSAVVIALQPS